MLFEREHSPSRRTDEIEVSFQRRGQVCITKAAYTAMGSPQAVQFDYMERHNVVLIPCRKDAPHSHPVRHQSGSYVISAVGLADAMGLDVRLGARRFPAIRMRGQGNRRNGQLNVMFMHDDGRDDE